jgi:hypothetical protein
MLLIISNNCFGVHPLVVCVTTSLSSLKMTVGMLLTLKASANSGTSSIST